MKHLQQYLSANLILSIIIFIIAIAFIIIINAFYKRNKNRFKSLKLLNLTSIEFSLSVIKILIIIFAAVLILQVNGYNISAMVTGLGLASAIIGLALQDTIKDVIMGTQIITDKFFNVGDVVRFNGYEGIVKKFSIRSTKIKLLANDNLYTISNRNINAIEVVSSTCNIDLPLPYELPLAEAKRVILLMVDKIKDLDHVSACSFLGTSDFADSAINYRISMQCTPSQKGQIRRNALGIMQEILEENHISIPYNQMDVTIKKTPEEK